MKFLHSVVAATPPHVPQRRLLTRSSSLKLEQLFVAEHTQRMTAVRRFFERPLGDLLTLGRGLRLEPAELLRSRNIGQCLVRHWEEGIVLDVAVLRGAVQKARARGPSDALKLPISRKGNPRQAFQRQWVVSQALASMGRIGAVLTPTDPEGTGPHPVDWRQLAESPAMQQCFPRLLNYWAARCDKPGVQNAALKRRHTRLLQDILVSVRKDIDPDRRLPWIDEFAFKRTFAPARARQNPALSPKGAPTLPFVESAAADEWVAAEIKKPVNPARLASGFAHDSNNFLTIIQGYLALLVESQGRLIDACGEASSGPPPIGLADSLKQDLRMMSHIGAVAADHKTLNEMVLGSFLAENKREKRVRRVGPTQKSLKRARLKGRPLPAADEGLAPRAPPTVLDVAAQYAAKSNALLLRGVNVHLATISRRHEYLIQLCAKGTLTGTTPPTLERSLRSNLSMLQEVQTAVARHRQMNAGVLRMASGLGAEAATSVKLTDVLDAAEPAIKRFVGSLKKVAISVEVDPNLPSVVAPPELLTLVVERLCANAGQAIEQSGLGDHLKISARVIDGHMRLEIADNGPGIPEAFQQAFKENKEGGSSKRQGHGVGMVRAKTDLAEHGITMEIAWTSTGTSTDPEKHGTIMAIDLPIAR